MSTHTTRACSPHLAGLLAAFLLLAGSACPERETSAPAPLPPCAQVGQRCEFSPGKLGACVQRDDCRGNDCFVCQSQH